MRKPLILWCLPEREHTDELTASSLGIYTPNTSLSQELIVWAELWKEVIADSTVMCVSVEGSLGVIMMPRNL